MPSSSSPELDGAPPVRYSLTAPTSMSDSSQVRPYVSQARSDGDGELVEPTRQRAGRRSPRRCRELEERDRHLAVLGLAARDGQVVAERPRHVLVEVDAGHVGRGRDRARAGREPRHQPGAVALLAEPRRVELRPPSRR